MTLGGMGLVKRSEKYLRAKSSKWTKSPESITRLVLNGSFIVAITLTLLLFVSLVYIHNSYVIHRVFVGLVALLYLGFAAHLIKRRYRKVAAWMLIALYCSVAGFILHAWGINAPIGILLLGFVIILTSILLGPKYISRVAVSVILLLIFLQFSSAFGLSHPDSSGLDNSSTFGDVASYATIFGVLALIAWVSGRQMEQSLQRALNAETELQKEKDSLATRLEEQTRSLHEAQTKEMGQLYRFAELGQLTTIILHELANYLSILTLDIEDLKDRHQNSIAIDRAKESIFYIDTIIDQVRNQINESDNIHRFEPAIAITNTLEQLKKKHPATIILLSDVRSSRQKRRKIIGDPLRLSQAITILVTNAAQAPTQHEKTSIFVEISSSSNAIKVKVKDYGNGISPESRTQLFQPHKSAKGGGLGIGLYITKQIIETHFKGKISIDPSTDFTQFNLEIPILR